MTFQRLARYDWRRELLPGEESSGDVRRRMEEEGDHRIHLLDLREQIRKNDRGDAVPRQTGATASRSTTRS